MSGSRNPVVSTRTVKADEEGMRLDRWFKLRFPDLPFGALQRLLRSGQIRVEGGRAKASARLSAGQTVRIPPLGDGSVPRSISLEQARRCIR